MRKFFLTVIFLCISALARAAFDPDAFNAAVALYNDHKLAEAQAAFEALAKVNPDNFNIQFYLGRMALQRDDAEKAVPYLEKAVALSPDDARFHLRLGDAYGLAAQKAGLFSKMGLAAKCKAEYEKAVALDGKSIEARQSLLNFYVQAPGFAGGSTEKALEQAQEIKKLDVGRGRIAVASVYARDKKFDLAFAEFDDALKANPDDYAALFQSGRLSAITGERLDHGLELLHKCLGMTAPPDQSRRSRLGALAYRLHPREERRPKAGARAAYETSLKVNPKFQYAIESLKKLN